MSLCSRALGSSERLTQEDSGIPGLESPVCLPSSATSLSASVDAAADSFVDEGVTFRGFLGFGRRLAEHVVRIFSRCISCYVSIGLLGFRVP